MTEHAHCPEAELAAAIALHRAAEAGKWSGRLLIVLVVAPFLAPAFETARWLKRVVS